MSINPTQQQKIILLIEQFKIKQLCDEYFADDFLWVVKGSGLLSKTYTNKESYFQDALQRLSSKLASGATLQVIHSYTTENSLILELQGDMQTKSGKCYNNEYCWIIRFNDDKIVSITAYLDTLLLDNILLDDGQSKAPHSV